MDIDFIKWMCEKAEGFCSDALTGGFAYNDGDMNTVFQTSVDRGMARALYSLLLQRAIEGVNRDLSISAIWQKGLSVCVRHGGFEVERHRDFYSIDQAKESALRYIFDKERER